MTRPLDAWILARLLSGFPVNGELESLSARFQAFGRHLNGLAAEDRAGAWDTFLVSQDDQGSINAAIAGAVPEGPAPEPTEDESDDGWGPIRLGTPPTPEPFPLDVLPIPARDLAEAAARSIGCPVDFPAVATLAAASGAIGRSACLYIKSGYFESASVFVALVGGSSDGKSPSLDAAMAPIRVIASQLGDDHRRAVASWEQIPEKERGDRPRMRRIDTSNPTVEALAPILADNPRGLNVLPDEFTGWCLSMGQYKAGKGGDKQFYLSAWSGSRAVIDRVKDAGNPTIVSHPFLTVAGGMTPGRLGTLASDGGDEDGFMNRLLFTHPASVKGRRYSEEGIPETVAGDWQELVFSLRHRPMRDLDGQLAPHVVRMSSEARRAWGSHCQAHLDEQEADDFSASLKGAWGKLQSYAARLALILHLMDLAADATRPADDEPPELPRRVVDDAWRLVAYFKSHVRRIRAATGGNASDGGEDVQALLGWIIRNEHRTFSTRDIDRNFDRFKQDPGALTDALGWMTSRNLIRPRPQPGDAKGKPGRKPSPSYEANPALWESPRFRQFRQNDSIAGGFVGNVGNAVDSEEKP